MSLKTQVLQWLQIDFVVAMMNWHKKFCYIDGLDQLRVQVLALSQFKINKIQLKS